MHRGYRRSGAQVSLHYKKKRRELDIIQKTGKFISNKEINKNLPEVI